MGVGVSSFSYWDGTHALADLQSQSDYRNNSWGAADTDTNGWPTSDGLLMVANGQLAAGTYKVVFQGQAVISPASGNIVNQVYNAAANQTTADWVLATPPSGAWLTFSNTRRTAASGTNTGLTNLHIWRPGIPTDGSVVFTPEFLVAIEKFDLIRFMDCIGANGNPSQHWQDRSLMRWAGDGGKVWDIVYQGTNAMYNGTATNTYWPGGFVGTRGRPWELMVLLANAASNDLWLNIPVRVDDDYITKLAQLIRYGSDGVNPYTNTQANPVYPPLKPGLKVYLEYGNEVWNFGSGFNCFNWVYDLGAAARLDSNHPICYDGVPDVWLAFYRYTAYRSSTISLIFRNVFGDAAMMTTVRPILSSQVGNANDILKIGLQWADGFYSVARTNNPVARSLSEIWYGGGGAAYYDSTVEPFYLVTNADTTVTATTDANLMTAYFAGLPNSDFATFTAVDAIWTKAYGLKLTSYEGGPGPGGSVLGGTSGSAVSGQYNADPRMKDRVIAAENTWIANGGDLLTYYCLVADSPWAFLDGGGAVTSTNSYKLQAIDTLHSQAKTNVTLGGEAPGVISMADPAASIKASRSTSSGLISLNAGADPALGDYIMVPMHTAAPGQYKFMVNYQAAAPATVELLVNGQSAGVWTLSAAGGLTASTRLYATLTRGLNVARIRPLSGSAAIHDLTVVSQYECDPPVFSPIAGSYNGSQSITLSSTTPGATIYFTTNGTVPSPTNGILYVGPLFLPISATINAMAVAANYTNSSISTATYVVTNPNLGALISWDFTAAGGNAASDGNVASVGSTYQDSGVLPGTLTRGAGASAAPLQWYPNRGAMNCHSLTYASLAAAKTSGSYFQFTVSSGTGQHLSLAAVEYAAYEQGSHATATLVTEYSTNGFATPGVPINTNSGIASGWNGSTNLIALSGIGALQHFSGTVTFRLWAYGFGDWEDAGLGEVSGNNPDVAVLGMATTDTLLLNIQKSGNALQMSWPQGALEEADDLTGPWITTSATSPFAISTTVAKKFYRVRAP